MNYKISVAAPKRQRGQLFLSTTGDRDCRLGRDMLVRTMAETPDSSRTIAALKPGICGLERRQCWRAAGRSKQFRFGMLAAARHAPRCASQPALVVGSGTPSGGRRNKMGHQPLDVALQHLGLTRVVMHADTETRHDLAPFQASPCQEF